MELRWSVCHCLGIDDSDHKRQTTRNRRKDRDDRDGTLVGLKVSTLEQMQHLHVSHTAMDQHHGSQGDE